MSLPREYWVDRTTQALALLLKERGGALLRPEAEAILSETSWVLNRNLGFPEQRRPQPHIITAAHTRLVEDGVVVDRTKVLNKRQVKIWVDARALGTSPDYSGFPHTKACNVSSTRVLGETRRPPDR